jgi:hypothetical protein
MRPFWMRALVATAVLWLLQTTAAAQTANVRIVDRALNTLFEVGLAQSPTLDALVTELNAAPILVFADCNMQMPSRIGARLNLLTSVGQTRYVRVRVDCALAPRHQIALLAHEIQHALEIAGRPDVLDEEDMESFYEQIGFATLRDSSHTRMETTAAIDVQQRVTEELGGRARNSFVIQ